MSKIIFSIFNGREMVVKQFKNGREEKIRKICQNNIINLSKIILATFDEFYDSLDPDAGIRGRQFEKFFKWYLTTDPIWATQVDKVWLWNEYPKS